MIRKFRDKLLLCFLLATLAPLGLTMWLAGRLLSQSVDLAPVAEVTESAAMLEQAGKALYATSRTLLKERVARGAVKAEAWSGPRLEAGEPEKFILEGSDLLLLRPEGAYRMRLEGARPVEMQKTVAQSREWIETHAARDWKRGFFLTLALSAGVVWLAGLGALLYFTARVTRPMQSLTRALREFGAGKRTALPVAGHDEVGEAIASFNDMSEQIERSREKLLYVTRVESWQALARKMAHEVKNSLTPIRLTVEEMVARSRGQEKAFLEQASQIVTDEVQTLERRVRAFSELASEPPLELEALDACAIVEERMAFLMSAHPEVIYRGAFAAPSLGVRADRDLLKGVLTNLLENAADAVQRGGVIRVAVEREGGATAILVEDSGPGLSLLARESLFQPTISFKRSGMGLGLSIAKRSAILMGGDLELAASSLGGAAFRLKLPAAELRVYETEWQNESLSSTTKKTLAAPSV